MQQIKNNDKSKSAAVNGIDTDPEGSRNRLCYIPQSI